jgi:hypothetical protein
MRVTFESLNLFEKRLLLQGVRLALLHNEYEQSEAKLFGKSLAELRRDHERLIHIRAELQNARITETGI